MRILGFGLILTIAFAVLGLDVGESLRTGSISDGSAHAQKRHHRKHHKKRARRHRKHSTAPATEM